MDSQGLFNFSTFLLYFIENRTEMETRTNAIKKIKSNERKFSIALRFFHTVHTQTQIRRNEKSHLLSACLYQRQIAVCKYF